MSFNIDKIRRKEILETPETVNANWASPSFSLDDRFGAFSLSIKWNNGSGGVDMKVYVQLSDDNETFGSIEESLVAVIDDNGSILYDSVDSGAPYCRIYVEVTTGSIDVYSIRYTGQQAH